MHLVGKDDQLISRLFHYLLHRADETQQGRNSCPRLQLFDFQFGLYHIVVPLNFLRSIPRSISLASLFYSLI